MKSETRAETVLALRNEGWNVSEIAELEGLTAAYVRAILYGLGIKGLGTGRKSKVERNQAVCDAYSTKNVSIRDLAKRFGVTFERIAQILRKENLIEMRVERNKLAKAEVASSLAENEAAARKRLRWGATLVLEGFSIAEASRQTGISMSVIQAHCKSLGVRSRHGKHRDFEQRKARVRVLHAEGLSFTALVERMRSEGDLLNYQWIWRNMPELRPQPGGRWNPRDRRVGDPST